MADEEKSGKKIIPIREGLFKVPSESGEKPYLFGSRCKVCAQMSFPPRKVCSKCFSEEMESIPLSSRGKLYTYTIIGYPPPGLAAPYAIGYVDLPEGVRVFSIHHRLGSKKFKGGNGCRINHWKVQRGQGWKRNFDLQIQAC